MLEKNFNRSILYRFQEICIFAAYTEIQDGHQKWENDFSKNCQMILQIP